MFTEDKITEVKAFLMDCDAQTSIFIGCDSKRSHDKQGNWVAAYTTVVVIGLTNEAGHSCGAVVFSDTEHMPDYDQKYNRPFLRMMNEAYKATELYQQLEDELMEFPNVEMHLDINKDARHGSNVAHNAAVGYARGITGREVKTKPDAWAATHVADHGVHGGFDKRIPATIH